MTSDKTINIFKNMKLSFFIGQMILLISPGYSLVAHKELWFNPIVCFHCDKHFLDQVRFTALKMELRDFNSCLSHFS